MYQQATWTNGSEARKFEIKEAKDNIRQATKNIFLSILHSQQGEMKNILNLWSSQPAEDVQEAETCARE